MMIEDRIIKVVFLTNKTSVYSNVTGGVQLCSQEFLHVIKHCSSFQVSEYHVNFTRKIIHRLLIRLGLENYNMYDVKKDSRALVAYLHEHETEIVFINMASSVRYAKLIRGFFGERIKVILLSHGNHSGDFLHLITKPLGKENIITRFIKKCRLGHLIATESEYRLKYLDGVVVLSETEKQIENWLNARRTLFFPRLIKPAFLNFQPDLKRIGFVGRLDHPPNAQGLSILCNSIKQKGAGEVKLRLVGAPLSAGKAFAAKYSFIEYLGELSDVDLEAEGSTWSFFLNPVWWYSTGASTKLAKGIGWGIPIATTTAGKRGYKWQEGDLLVADTPNQMVEAIFCALKSRESVLHFAKETRKAAESAPNIDELTAQIEQFALVN